MFKNCQVPAKRCEISSTKTCGVFSGRCGCIRDLLRMLVGAGQKKTVLTAKAMEPNHCVGNQGGRSSADMGDTVHIVDRCRHVENLTQQGIFSFEAVRSVRKHAAAATAGWCAAVTTGAHARSFYACRRCLRNFSSCLFRSTDNAFCSVTLLCRSQLFELFAAITADVLKYRHMAP